MIGLNRHKKCFTMIITRRHRHVNTSGQKPDSYDTKPSNTVAQRKTLINALMKGYDHDSFKIKLQCFQDKHLVSYDRQIFVPYN